MTFASALPSMIKPVSALLLGVSSLVIGAIVDHRSRFMRFFFFILLAYGILTFSTSLPDTLHPMARSFMATSILPFIYMGLDYILITDIQQAFRAPGQKEPVANAHLEKRIAWSAALLQDSRGLGWNWEPRGIFHRPPPGMTASTYITEKIPVLAQHLVVTLAGSAYMVASPGFDHGIGMQPWFWRCVDIAVLGFFLNSVAGGLNILSFVISVARGSATPQECVPLYGHWEDAYSIKRFWGRTWHQQLRRCLSTPGKYLAHEVLRLPRGSNAAYYIQIYVAFSMSGLFHGFADVQTDGDWSEGWYTLVHGFLQAVAISFEDFIAYVARQMGVREGLMQRSWVWRWIGYLWVLLWHSATWPMMVDHMVVVARGNEFLRLPYHLLVKFWNRF